MPVVRIYENNKDCGCATSKAELKDLKNQILYWCKETLPGCQLKVDVLRGLRRNQMSLNEAYRLMRQFEDELAGQVFYRGPAPPIRKENDSSDSVSSTSEESLIEEPTKEDRTENLTEPSKEDLEYARTVMNTDVNKLFGDFLATLPQAAVPGGPQPPVMQRQTTQAKAPVPWAPQQSHPHMINYDTHFCDGPCYCHEADTYYGPHFDADPSDGIDFEE